MNRRNRRRFTLISLALVLGAATAGAVAARTIPTATRNANSNANASVPSLPPVSASALKGTDPVTVDTLGTPAGTLNNGYIGLSYGNDLLNTRQLDDVGNLPQLMNNLGTSVLRFGGIVADEKFPGITPAGLAALTRLTKATGWSAFYTMNIGQFNASAVSAQAAEVSQALGPNLAGIACGNEPEFLAEVGVRPANYTIGDYLSDAANCIAAVDDGLPNAPIEGPDTISYPDWPASYAANEKGLIKQFGIHFYALPCGLKGESPAQRGAELLAPSETSREDSWFNWASADAKTAGAQLWMTEVNTACGGGDPGLSNSFASALWVVDYLLTGAEHGVSGMNVQGSLTTCKGYVLYSPLCEVSANEYAAQPIYYGMLFTHLLGTGQLLPVTVSNGNLVAFALKTATGGLHVMIENLGTRPEVAGVNAPGSGPSSATVLHLTAPSVLATSGVTIQGATVGADGKLASTTPDTVACSGEVCPVQVAPDSAVLVDLSK